MHATIRIPNAKTIEQPAWITIAVRVLVNRPASMPFTG
eukprot:CAMPEP_0119065812 /NCGR_PEP_ID=MMETSP1178-20130426/8535_1 /TAXON_ID=33656 /ORGANISM="unid sp, Strain CCMP2000" /LENGTH=37 /DNA_ID= /DNA_START= /DNA_END= /DNA_ORIENTATION=